MTRILILSDTHVHRFSDIPNAIIEVAKDSDVIFHAGDIAHQDVLDGLGAITKVVAVRGNMDVLTGTSTLPVKREVLIEKIRIGIVHGAGVSGRVVGLARSSFDDCSVIVFGHSHFPFLEEYGGVLMINPGSPTDKRSAPFPSYATMEINHFEVKVKIMSLAGKVLAQKRHNFEHQF